MTDKEALKLAKELDGVIADVEEGMGFDDVCLGTLKYVRDALTEPQEKYTYGTPLLDAMTGKVDHIPDAGKMVQPVIKQDLTSEQPARQCWKCGDMDAAYQAKCTVPACGMKEQPAQQQEPVAHCEAGPEHCPVCHKELNPEPAIYPDEAYEMGLEEVAFYTSPPASKPLTDEQIQECWYRTQGEAENFARAIEAAHGIKGDA